MLASAPQTESFNPSTVNTRFNGLKHGAASKELFLHGENPDEFFALLDDSFRYYKPVTSQQAELIKDLTEARWQLNRRRRVHDEHSKRLHDTKLFVKDWNDDDMNRTHRFDRYLTQAERSLQRALANVRSMHTENVRSSKWKQLHELQKQKFELQRQKFELAQAHERRRQEIHETRKSHAANKTVIGIQSAKNAVSSPSKAAPDPAQSASRAVPFVQPAQMPVGVEIR